MPQLDLVAVLPQYVWLLITYGGLYWTLEKHLLPRVARVVAVRRARLRLSQGDVQEFHQEAQELQGATDRLWSQTCGVAATMMTCALGATRSWITTTLQGLRRTAYGRATGLYLRALAATSLGRRMTVAQTTPHPHGPLALAASLTTLAS
jgi:hypothetical protein